MININPSFFHDLFKVAIRNAVPDIKENRRDEDAATAFFKQAINNNGFPDKVVMDKSGANYAHEILGTPVANYSFTYGANWISPSTPYVRFTTHKSRYVKATSNVFNLADVDHSGKPSQN
jgi:transposase-like protein